jgi:histidinol-phosphatase
MDLDNLMEFAVRTAQRAGEITLRHFGAVATERKGDGTEVTAADRESEVYLLHAIAEAFPDDGILGEEGGAAESRTGRRWIVDPIDGTRSFSSGVPLYGVLIALEDRGVPVLGCCHLPALAETVVAAAGAGAWHNGSAARVSQVDDLAEARVMTSGLEYWRDWATAEGQEGWSRLVGRARFAKTWGDCYGYMLVATGRAEIMVDPAAGAPWDYLPMVPIMAEAGARFTTLAGAPAAAWTSALASNGHLHDEAMGCWEARGRGDAAVQIPMILARQPR